jgi:hypothetical protein
VVIAFDDGDGFWEHAEDACRPCQEASLPYFFIPSPRRETVTGSTYETYHEQVFDGYAKLHEHDRDVHDFCTTCKRDFWNKRNLHHHLNFKLHQPATRNYCCPCRGCNKSLVYPAALILTLRVEHLPLVRAFQQLDRLIVRRADANNYNTNSSDCLLLSSDLTPYSMYECSAEVISSTYATIPTKYVVFACAFKHQN